MSPFSAPFFWDTKSERPLLPNRATAFRHFGRGTRNLRWWFQTISWEEREKQKARRCRAQEYGPKQCRRDSAAATAISLAQANRTQVSGHNPMQWMLA
jgi:hypothetical protein